MSIGVTNKVKSYDEPSKPDIKVHSHWNDRSMVVLELDEDNRRTVVAEDLIAAIKNATNTGAV